MTQKTDLEAVRKAVFAAFEVGNRKDFERLAKLHADDDRFTKFSDIAPYRRQSAREAALHEEMTFANISDYTFTIDDLKIDLFGDVAIATFYVEYGGIIVDDYTFTGRTMKAKSRGTMVFHKRDSNWLIVHEHFSRMPDQ